MIDHYRSRLDAATEAFLSDASTTGRDKTALLDYLEARPNRGNDVPFYINHVEWRIENARKVHRILQRGGQEYLNPLSWSILMVTPTEHIQKQDAKNLITTITPQLEVLLKICRFNMLQGGHTNQVNTILTISQVQF